MIDLVRIPDDKRGACDAIRCEDGATAWVLVPYNIAKRTADLNGGNTARFLARYAACDKHANIVLAAISR